MSQTALKLSGSNWHTAKKPAGPGEPPYAAHVMTMVGAPVYCEVWKPGPFWRWEVFANDGVTLANGRSNDVRRAKREALIAAKRVGRERGLT